MTPHPLIIDCDPGVDDALALLLAAAPPELDLLAVTCVAGNRPVDQTARNACRVLDLAGRSDVPVHAGCSRPLTECNPRCNLVHGEDGLAGLTLPQIREPSNRLATDVLEQLLLDTPADRLILAAIGPLTNLAVAEIRRPGLLQRAHAVLVMGGAAFCEGNITPSAEFNFYADALAAHTVLQSGARVWLFGLDVTRQAAMPPEWINALSQLGNRCGDAARAMLRSFSRPNPRLHDTCPIAWMLAPDLFSSQRCAVAVDWRPGLTEGHLAARRLTDDASPQAGVAEVVTSVEAAGLRALVRERLARLP
jgi:purine nucleosidase